LESQGKQKGQEGQEVLFAFFVILALLPPAAFSAGRVKQRICHLKFAI
jgi:hypothetical protein